MKVNGKDYPIYIYIMEKNVPNHPPDINWDTMDIPPTLTFFTRDFWGATIFLDKAIYVILVAWLTSVL